LLESFFVEGKRPGENLQISSRPLLFVLQVTDGGRGGIQGALVGGDVYLDS